MKSSKIDQWQLGYDYLLVYFKGLSSDVHDQNEAFTLAISSNDSHHHQGLWTEIKCGLSQIENCQDHSNCHESIFEV